MRVQTRLSILFFLQFAIWGCYLVCLGQYLGSIGLGTYISYFYAIAGFISLFTPAIAGYIADRYSKPSKVLAVSQLMSALFMGGAWLYCVTADKVEFTPLFILFTAAMTFYMPTMPLSNSAAFMILRSEKLDTAKTFPSIRIWGTVGFIAAMWFVNSFYYKEGQIGLTLTESDPMSQFRFQYTSGQLLASAITGLIATLWATTLFGKDNLRTFPGDPTSRKSRSFKIRDAATLISSKNLGIFFLFSMLLGVALQINNGYMAPYISHFRAIDEFAKTFGAGNATMLSSISQISETLCMLLVGIALTRFGIKKVVLAAMGAWVINFLFLGLGNPGNGLWMFIVAMLVYGIGFDFFNIAGSIYVDRVAPEDLKASAQGTFMMMSKGVGATAGMLCAGAVVNHFCHWEMTPAGRFFLGDWTTVWILFSGYALAVGIVFLIFFKEKK